ncbi:MAG: hypothetical protein EB017_13355 [Betaproteobacteria bacterium]|nr:hypothetical protein [Betaproteobacteria bacterium]
MHRPKSTKPSRLQKKSATLGRGLVRHRLPSNLDQLVDTGQWICEQTGIRPQTRVGNALAAKKRSRDAAKAEAANA